MDKTFVKPSVVEEMHRIVDSYHTIKVKSKWFKNESEMACREFTRLIDDVTPTLKKCNDTHDVIIVVDSFRKRFKRLHRNAKFYGFLARIFK